MTGSKNVLSVSFSQKDLEADEELHEGVTVMKMISKGLKLKKNWPAKKNPKWPTTVERQMWPQKASVHACLNHSKLWQSGA